MNAIDNVAISSPVTNLVVKTDQLTSTMACKIDTRAEGNVLPIEKYHELFPKAKYKENGEPANLASSDIRIEAYGGSKILHYGKCQLSVTHNSITRTGVTCDCCERSNYPWNGYK